MSTDTDYNSPAGRAAESGGCPASPIRRLAAFILDIFILAGAPLIWPEASLELLSGIGPYGPWIGYLGAMLYFTLLESRIGRGQTVGKRLLGIRVVTFEGGFLTLRMAFARTMILVGSFAVTDDGALASLPPFLAALLYAVGGLTTLVVLYLFLVNWRGGQSLHDMAAGTVVATTWEAPPAIPRPVRRGHWVAIRILYAVAFLCGLVGAWFAEKGEMSAIRRTVVTQPGVESADLHAWSIHSLSTFDIATGETKTRTARNFIQITVTMQEPPADGEDTARRIMEAVAAGHPEIAKRNTFMIVVRHGFDLGISSGWNTHTTTWSRP